MRLISLLTDFGRKDNYVGVMKGVIYTINPEAIIVDLCHEVSPQNALEASFILNSSYRYFPDESIHVVVVDPGVGGKRKIICLRTKRYFFLAPDNGVLTPILRKKSYEEMVEVSNPEFFLTEVSRTFHGRDIFAPVAAHISRGIALSELGPNITQAKEINIPTVIPSGDRTLKGEVIYIDRFGNLVTNISKSELENLKKRTSGKKVSIRLTSDKIAPSPSNLAPAQSGKGNGFKSHHLEISKISKSYSESKPGKTLAIIGSSNYLEISVCQGNAAKELAAGIGQEVTVQMLGC